MSRRTRTRLEDIALACAKISGYVERADNEDWREIARMRDQLAHRYFDTAHAVVTTTARNDIPQLAAATARLLDGRDDED